MAKLTTKLLLIFCVLLWITGTVFAEVKCRDVTETHWAYSALEVALPIIGGCEYNGDKLVNRYMIAGVIEGMIKEFGIKIPENAEDLKFEDIPKYHPRTEAILISTKVGILQGFEGKFHGDKLVNRYQMAVIMNKLLEQKDPNMPAIAKPIDFKDLGRTHWAYSSVQRVVSEGILRGFDGRFHGDKLVNRYEMAEIIEKLLLKK